MSSVLIGGLAAACALLMIGAPSAHAGTYAITATDSQVCALGQFSSNVPGFGTSCAGAGPIITAPPGGAAGDDRQLFQVTSPDPALVIGDVSIAGATSQNVGAGGNLSYGGGAYWDPSSANGGQAWNGDSSFVFDSGPIASSYFGLQLLCNTACPAVGGNQAPTVEGTGTWTIAVQENQGPAVGAIGANNILNATGWVWNPAGDPWSSAVDGTDPSGVCSIQITANSGSAVTQEFSRNTSVFQQCPSPATFDAALDTTTYVPSSGQLTLVVSGGNAAGVESQGQTVVDVDNVQPTIALAALNDTNPGGWAVNHAVSLQVAPVAGPSGISSVNCSDTVNHTTSPLTLSADPSVPGDYDVTVDGNGTHQISCSVANNAVNPQGAHNAGTVTQTVDIDEQPPSLTFEPTDPTNPTQVVVQSTDNESLVAGGSIEITAQGSSTPITLPTSFTSDGQLIATIPDSTLKAGAYTLQGSATSEVGNIGTTAETVTLPLRTKTVEAVSFAKIADKLVVKKVTERVLVGWHYAAKLNKQGKPVKVKVGGHYKTIKVLKRVEQCTTRRVKVAKHTWKLKTTCAKPHIRYQKKLTVGHGKWTTVYGELTTTQDVPVADATVEVITVPKNGSGRATRVALVTTNAAGGWSARVPAGPSRTVEGHYVGSAVLLPQTARGDLSVPARITIRVSSHRARWNGVVTISGRLKGGYIPKDGVAMRLLITLPGRKTPYSPVPFRTTAKGTFKVKWSWGTGSGVVTYPFSVATTADESDYPFSASASPRVKVTFGR